MTHLLSECQMINPVVRDCNCVMFYKQENTNKQINLTSGSNLVTQLTVFHCENNPRL